MFFDKNLLSYQRIGPHNEDVISVLVGSLLGDGFAESRSSVVRFTIHMSTRNISYLYWLHDFFSVRGYCSLIKPPIKKMIGVKGKVYYTVKLQTYSFSSLNFLRDAFYTVDNRKVVPLFIEELLTPLALAIWIMDDGSAHNSGGCVLSTNSFTLSDCKILQNAFFNKWGLIVSLHVQNTTQYRLYFGVKQMPFLTNLVRPYIVPTMLYKLHIKP